MLLEQMCREMEESSVVLSSIEVSLILRCKEGSTHGSILAMRHLNDWRRISGTG